jgi:predicted transcriptional regulator
LTTFVNNLLGRIAMEQPPLGDLELEVLRFVAENAPLSVGVAAQQFGVPRGLARTTILTIMERLRKKGYLARSKHERPARYSPRIPQNKVEQGLVREFVEKTLAGSLSPFVAYLAEAEDLTDGELLQLRRLVEDLEVGRRQGAEEESEQ